MSGTDDKSIVTCAADGQILETCKPGGHGVIWKLAYHKGVFQWFHNQGREGSNVQQVSNVVAATDVTLLAIVKIGLHEWEDLP
ncbi:hypothetical protein M8C21_014076 [Ambrosia artemisiifolia]|uniref:Uncharacterized protein n=1 Tax=Ambrosia artemisiifolia TaxID=4212 RepID=A0AAD5CWZ4_AMBAR|nr:hypothetical protein M8C21_014076 [Ambrosia artemisiifolia]